MTEDLFWHFLPDDGRLQFGSREKVVVGKTLKMAKKPKMCVCGYHVSVRAIDALRYAPGALVCRVTIGGDWAKCEDKLVAQERTVIWMADATETLHQFACTVAKEALDKYAPDNAAGYTAIEAKRRWLCGEATDYVLHVARAAAGDAAWYAARAAARDAARAAARAAARDAAGDAAGAAARAAAWGAAGDAARAAAGAAAGDAARYAARAAAWGAARDAARYAAGAAARAAARDAAGDAAGYAARAAAWGAQNVTLTTALLELGAGGKART